MYWITISEMIKMVGPQVVTRRQGSRGKTRSRTATVKVPGPVGDGGDGGTEGPQLGYI